MWYLFAPLLFLNGLVTDIIWTIYIQRVAVCKTKKERAIAGLYSIGTGIVSAIWVEGVLYVPYLLPVWLLGLWVGTYNAQAIETFLKGKWDAIHKSRRV